MHRLLYSKYLTTDVQNPSKAQNRSINLYFRREDYFFLIKI